jgi:TRAP transporter 4TM/12TM fusion protein
MLNSILPGNLNSGFSAPVKVSIYASSICLTLYILWYTLMATTDRHLHGAIFILFSLPVCFLAYSANPLRWKPAWFDYLLALGAALSAGYYILNRSFYRGFMEGMEPLGNIEIGVGLALILLSLEASRRCIGWGLTAIALVLVAYCAWGNLIGGEFGHSGFTLDYFISRQTVGDDGVFGVPLDVAATYAFLFVLFGTLFQYAGGGDLVYGLAAALTKNSVAGLPKACVVSSALYGSVSGSPVADVVTTGPITIPLMIKSGVSPVRAGALEAAASCGGAFLPPVMGAVAFLMLEFTGLTYLEICLAATAPALIYYVSIFAQVHFRGLKDPSVGNAEGHTDTVMQTLKKGWYHLIPIAVLCVLLVKGYTPAFVGSASAIAVIVSSWLSSDRSKRIGLRGAAFCAYDTGVKMAGLGAAVLCAGIILGAIDMSGLTGKFTALLVNMSGGSFAGGLLVSALVLILLGMGMPTPAVYIMGVALIAPVLQKFGVPLMPAHMFILFLSCMSAITPPMAVACFACATIAKASPMKIGIDASLRVGLIGMILPFFIVLNYGVVLQGNWVTIGLDITAGFALALGAGFAMSGFNPSAKLGAVPRGIAVIGCAMCITPEATTKVIGILLVAVVVGFALLQKPKSSPVLSKQ